MKRNKMKKAYAAAVCGVLTLSLVFPSGCKGASPGSDISADLSTILTLKTASFDFGMLEADAETGTISVTITNDGSDSVSLSQFLLSDMVNFSIEDSPTPLVIAPGESSVIICLFHPEESGDLETDLEISADGFELPLQITLEGEGNYPPTSAPGLMVYDADRDIAGFYCPDGALNGKTLYRNNENPQYLLFFHQPSAKWVLDEDTSIVNYYDGARYQDSRDKGVHQEPQEVTSWNKDFTDVFDDVTGPVVSGADLSDLQPKVTIVRAYYFFCDTENDAEDTSLLTWYRCIDTSDPGTVLAGITGQEYTVQNEDIGCYLRVEIIPCASSGITEGNPVSGDISRLLEVGGL